MYFTYILTFSGVDTADMEKDSRPGFMQHFDKKDEHKKKIGKKQDPNGPHDISYYFPDIPEGMDFRDFVRVHIIIIAQLVFVFLF